MSLAQKYLRLERRLDVTFSFQNSSVAVTLLRAHKSKLMRASSYFKAHFNENFDRANIDIAECDRATMNELLRFIYTGEFRIPALRIPELLIAANRFAVRGIFGRIAKELKEALDKAPKDTVKVVLRLLKVFVELQLHEDSDVIKQSCVGYIGQNFAKIAGSYEWTLQSRRSLMMILESSRLKANELDVWRYSLKWARATALRTKKSNADEDLREVLGPALHRYAFR